ncbi:hypothetical protein EW145_g8058 [Phellinidium pouzarii]|uniref:PPM-type phosphatase domain-containing protein n=1 Tax=Phellinidium pouzarii TaxID=167371 RepID=A0A4S4KA95_9AGAM|nr:hypothetical protein EW145_g8058 [Phellinidium pouzarii]
MNSSQDDNVEQPTTPALPAPLPAHVATPMRFSDSPNARSKTITTAMGAETHGTLNQHLAGNPAYQVGVHDDKGQRRTMEDSYSFVVDFASVRGQGYFAVFDGHAGKYAAEWCGQYFHEHLISQLHARPTVPVPDVLNHTFHAVDSALSEIARNNDKMHSGCTAVTAFLRLEDAQGGQAFLEGVDVGEASSQVDPARNAYPSPEPSPKSSSPSSSSRSASPVSNEKKKGSGSKFLNKGSQVLSAIKSLTSTSSSNLPDDKGPGPMLTSGSDGEVFVPPPSMPLRRVLYTANAGDARAVLCRGGRAVRLTYDHKGSDKQEAKRITDAGGFVTSGRVYGVLAVTRSLGDSSMKDFVVGSPYTTETELGDDDEFLILACDGVWDVTSDQDAVDIVRKIGEPQEAARVLVEHALKESTDNITVIVVRFPSSASA